MEVNNFDALESMIATVRDREFLAVLEEHRSRTHEHARRLEHRLSCHGREPSSVKDLGGTLKATAKAFGDQLREDMPIKNARDCYVAGHAAIATYAVLERIAQRAGDDKTARLAREHRRDGEAIATWIAERWERFVDRSVSDAEPRPDREGM